MNPPAECNEQFGLKERKEHDPTSPDRIVRFVAYVLSGIIRNKSNQCVDTATLRTEVDKYADTISTVLENASPEQFNTVDRQKLQQALGSLVKEKLRVLSMQNTTNSLKSYPKILELYWLSRKSRTPEQIEAKLQKALAIANHFKIPLGVGLMLSFQGASVEGILSLQNSPVITNAGFSNADLIKVLSSDLTAYSKYTLLAASNLVLRLRPTKSTLKLVTCSNSIFDIHTKLEVMLDDEFKELKDQFRGSSFGLALQTGSAEDLRAKLKVILDDEFKELKDQFRGHSFGLALQNGSAEDLRAKLCYLKDINDKFRSHDKNNSYYLIIFIANLTRYFMGERRSASRDLEVTSRCLMDLDLSNLELNLLEASQGNKSQPKVDDINRLLTAEHGLSKDLANIVASFFAGNRAGIKNQQIQSLFRVLLGPQVNRRTTSISRGSIPEDYRSFLATQELGIEKVEIRDGLSRWILKHQLALPKYTLDHLVEVLVGSDVLDINIEEILDQRMKDSNLSAAELLDQLLALLYGVTDDS